MDISDDPSYAATTVLKFVVFEATARTGAFGSTSWNLRFGAADTESEPHLLQSVQVCCVAANHLAELRILDGDNEVFAVLTHHDSVGRACTAGAMLLAMYGLDSHGCLTVPAAEFDRPVRSDRAVVQLRVHGLPALSLACIQVSARLLDGPTS